MHAEKLGQVLVSEVLVVQVLKSSGVRVSAFSDLVTDPLQKLCLSPPVWKKLACVV